MRFLNLMLYGIFYSLNNIYRTPTMLYILSHNAKAFEEKRYLIYQKKRGILFKIYLKVGDKGDQNLSSIARSD